MLQHITLNSKVLASHKRDWMKGILILLEELAWLTSIIRIIRLPSPWKQKSCYRK